MRIVFNSLILILLISSNIYSQGIQYGKEFQVNSYTWGEQYYPSVAKLKNGGFMICWQSNGQDGYDGGIYGQLFDDKGHKQGNEFQIHTRSEFSQENPAVANLENGGFIVCWEGGNLQDIFGQRFDASGAKQGNEFIINTITSGVQTNSCVAGLADGGFVCCWENYKGGGSDIDVQGQIFNASGAKRGQEFRINTFTNNHQCRPSVTGLRDGRFVVCWESWGQGIWGSGIYGQFFDASGNKQGQEFQVFSRENESQECPAIAQFSDHRLVICWDRGETFESSIQYSVYCQLIDDFGNKIGAEFRVKNYKMFSGSSHPVVASLPHGGFMFCWQERFEDIYWYDILGQLFDPSGKPLGHEFMMVQNRSYWQENACVVGLQDSSYVVCWQSSNQDGSDRGVFGAIFPEPRSYQLQEFSLIAPLNDETLNRTELVFLWSQPGGLIEFYPCELTFDLYLDADLNFPHPQVIKGIEDTTCIIDSLAAGKTYFWKVLAKNLAGDSLWSKQQDWGFFIKHGATAVETAEQNLPSGFELFQNYP
ncbi:MAG: hypothetical protein ONB16_12595, partial [candidate division KSB1 bacterium]|nr:hypothetical protein [candidate division KSB1 bacterium]